MRCAIVCVLFQLTAVFSDAAEGWSIIEKRGRHAMVTSEGEAVFLLGINHLSSAPAGRAGPEYYADALVRIARLGYVNAGYGTPPYIRDRMPFIAGGAFTYNGHARPRESFRYEDVFDPEVQQEIRKRVLALIERPKDHPNLIGFYWTDTPRWDIDLAHQRRGTDWATFIRQLPADAPGKAAYAQFLREHYNNDPAAYSKAYGHVIASFDDLRLNEYWEFDRTNEAALADDRAFLGLIARELYRVIGETFHEHARGKLLFGERYKLHDHPDVVLQEAAKWVDVVSIQPGPEVGPLPGPGQDESRFDGELFDHIHELTGKPILICDHQVSFHTDEHPTTLWHQCGDMDEALSTSKAWALAAVERPYIVGYQRCQYADVFNPHRGNMLKQGLIRLDGTPYPGIETEIQEMNQAIRSAWESRWREASK